MISDTLSLASHEIKQYLSDDRAGMYRAHQDQIVALLADMDAVRALLDTPPDDTRAAP